MRPSPYIYPGLSKIIREMIHPQPFVLAAAQPLFENIMKQIEKNGGVNLTIDYLHLENPKIYGWNQSEIRARIRSRLKIQDSNGTKRVKWTTDELTILLANPFLTSGHLSKRYLKRRSASAIREMRQKIRK